MSAKSRWSSPRRQLIVVAVAQVLVMGLWFSASAVVPALREDWTLSRTGITWMTASVQVGFVTGALISAVLNLADRISPHRLIACSALVGAAANLTLATLAHGIAAALPLRFATGIALAGVYPVGMKVLTSWFARSRGLALGVLVGALTLGSGMPHLINGAARLPWRETLGVASGFAVVGAAIALRLIRLGPAASVAPPFVPSYLVTMFRDRPQRLICFGYFGHMWELYAMWAWLPAFVAASLTAWRDETTATQLLVGLTSFGAIGLAGAVGCWLGGVMSDRHGRHRTVTTALAVSGLSCLAAAAVFGLSPLLLMPVLVLWGASIIADSAQFSAALSEAADKRFVGTALTAQTAIGFLLTVISIQLTPILAGAIGWRWTPLLLAAGPILGIIAMHRLGPEAARPASGLTRRPGRPQADEGRLPGLPRLRARETPEHG